MEIHVKFNKNCVTPLCMSPAARRLRHVLCGDSSVEVYHVYFGILIILLECTRAWVRLPTIPGPNCLFCAFPASDLVHHGPDYPSLEFLRHEQRKFSENGQLARQGNL